MITEKDISINFNRRRLSYKVEAAPSAKNETRIWHSFISARPTIIHSHGFRLKVRSILKYMSQQPLNPIQQLKTGS